MYKEDYMMSKILVDNWQMEDLILNSVDTSSGHLSKAYGDILNAIVLWDEIYYPQNIRSQAWNYHRLSSDLNVANVIKPLKDDDFFAKESQEIYEKYFKGKATSVVAEGAIRYSLLSNSYNMGYLPSEKRAEFFDTINNIETFEKMFKICIKNRKNSLEMLDNIIEERFLELKSHLPMIKWNFQYPVLIDYIKYNCNDESSYIDVALEIKREKEVVRYRKYIDKFEKALEEENVREIMQFDKAIQEIVDDILKISE